MNCTALCWKQGPGLQLQLMYLLVRLLNFLMPPFLQNDTPAILGRMGESVWDEQAENHGDLGSTGRASTEPELRRGHHGGAHRENANSYVHGLDDSVSGAWN